MMDIIGAMSTAAEAALMASAPSRRARFLVFHFPAWLAPASGRTVSVEPERVRECAGGVAVVKEEGFAAASWSWDGPPGVSKLPMVLSFIFALL
jgi:hypothetical protein